MKVNLMPALLEPKVEEIDRTDDETVHIVCALCYPPGETHDYTVAVCGELREPFGGKERKGKICKVCTQLWPTHKSTHKAK